MKKFSLLGAVCACVFILTTSIVNAAIIDTITVTSSRIIVGGGTDRYAYVDRLLEVPIGATVESFTLEILTSTGTVVPQDISFVYSLDPFISGGASNLPGLGIPVDIVSSTPGVVYNTLFGFIEGSSVDFPLEIRVSYPNDGETSLQESTIGITVNGQLAAVPIPPALWLFGSGLLGLIGMARRTA